MTGGALTRQSDASQPVMPPSATKGSSFPQFTGESAHGAGNRALRNLTVGPVAGLLSSGQDQRVRPAEAPSPLDASLSEPSRRSGDAVTGSLPTVAAPSLNTASGLTGLSAPLRHWVISDVHGCAEALLLLISRLPARDRIVLCGDVINRGPHIEAAMDLAWDLVVRGRAVWLMGNHEQKLARLLRSGMETAWDDLAGCTTFRQLGERTCRGWLERLERLPLTYWGRGWVATHAGFDPSTWLPDLTVRMAFWQAYDGRFGEVIVGHTPGPDVRRLNGRITLIDTGACYGGPLTAYCPETGLMEQVPGLASLSSPRRDLSLALSAHGG